MISRTPLARCLTGAALARTGDEMSGPALLLAGFAATGSTSGSAALLAALTAASALGGPLLGIRLDRSPRPGRLLARSLGLYAAGLLAVLAALGRLPLPAVLPLAAAAGLLGPAVSAGWTSQLPRVAPLLARSTALDAMTYDAAALAGPALAGATATALGGDAAVLIAAALIAAALPAAWALPARDGTSRAGLDDTDPHPDDSRPRLCPTTAPEHAAPGREAVSLRAELASGLRVLMSRPALARATVVSVGASAGQGMLAACLPLLGERALGGANRGPLLLACTAVAALLANAVLARRPHLLAPDAAVRFGALLQAAALALAATGGPLVLVVAAVLAGLGEGPQLTGLFAVRHREAPSRLRSQIFATGASLKITAFALGAALAGPLATRSVPATLALAAALTAAAALCRPPRRGNAPAARRGGGSGR
ncbi:MFS transporter [Kitasatospora sp. NPDC059795]|uniref:MFS transporter n=1 Tax=Kitasatospora sp. NPDC059795 TaxID=3346949 RepID=UPI00365CECCE